MKLLCVGKKQDESCWMKYHSRFQHYRGDKRWLRILTKIRASPLQLFQIHNLLPNNTASTVACGRASVSVPAGAWGATPLPEASLHHAADPFEGAPGAAGG